jgi:signal transduction histidine kinase
MQKTSEQAETLLCNVVHDLRQPLGTIEISAYLLNQILRDAPEPVREYLSVIERQVDAAARTLDEAASVLSRLRDEHASAFELTPAAAISRVS